MFEVAERGGGRDVWSRSDGGRRRGRGHRAVSSHSYIEPSQAKTKSQAGRTWQAPDRHNNMSSSPRHVVSSRCDPFTLQHLPLARLESPRRPSQVLASPRCRTHNPSPAALWSHFAPRRRSTSYPRPRLSLAHGSRSPTAARLASRLRSAPTKHLARAARASGRQNQGRPVRVWASSTTLWT